MAAPIASGMKSQQEYIEAVEGGELPWQARGVMEQVRGKVVGTSFTGSYINFVFGVEEAAAAVDPFNGLDLQLRRLNGSVEVAPTLGLADVIVDLVESGQTLQDNGLKEILTIFESEAALLIRGSYAPESNRFVNAVRDRIAAVL